MSKKRAKAIMSNMFGSASEDEEKEKKKKSEKSKDKRAKPTKPLGKHLSETFREYKNKQGKKK